jgi:hypothetical protein
MPPAGKAAPATRSFRPAARALARVTAAIFGEMSVATTRRPARASATASSPVPHPISSSVLPRGNVVFSSTRLSRRIHVITAFFGP